MAIDWLKSIGCRVIPLMGGEPLLRKDFILEVIRYAAENDFFVYLPTNGYLLDKSFIDEAGRAGIAAINLAVDCVSPRKGLPKALLPIEPQFRYLVEQQKKYGYILFFNINICKTNIRDVRLLTEIAHQNHIGTDYHLNERPLDFLEVEHYKHREEGLYITPDEFEAVDDLLDWIIDKHRKGWPMVNSISHLQAFKHRTRNPMQTWPCRAGINGALIRPDGTLSPCFDLMPYDYDWGRVSEPNFDREKLMEIKKRCLHQCSSTCFSTIGYYYNLKTLPEWVLQHMRVG